MGNISGATDTESVVDDAAVTLGTQRVLPAGFLADETSPDSVNEGDAGMARMSLDRIQYTRAFAGLSTQHLASASRSVSPSGENITAHGMRGIFVDIGVTVSGGSAAIRLSIRALDVVSGTYSQIVSQTAVGASATHFRFTIYPGITARAAGDGEALNRELPPQFQLQMVHDSTTGAFTYSVSYQLLP